MTEPVSLTLNHIAALVRQVDGFAKGRASSIANTKARLSAPTEAIRREYDIDRLSTHPRRGCATRIARKLGYDRRFTARVLARLIKEMRTPSSG